MANTHMKRFSTSVVIRERYKLKPQGDTTFTPTGYNEEDWPTTGEDEKPPEDSYNCS